MSILHTYKRYILAAGLLLCVPVWLYGVVPYMQVPYPDSFSYEANIRSTDNFYNENVQQFGGEQLSRSTYTYNVVDTKGHVQIVQHNFFVETLDGDPIVSLTRKYGIDSDTGAHVPGFGDKDREGYLFAPAGITPEETFTYWHINYDAPAEMKFAGEDELNGLNTYIYETRYEGQTIDQTDVLSHLPGVPEERGVRLESHLKIWVEPTTGYLVKYEDITTAYYYDQEIGEDINPWNRFHNEMTETSVRENVASVQQGNFAALLQERFVPMVCVLWAIALVYIQFRKKEDQSASEERYYRRSYIICSVVALLVLCMSIVVMSGWIFQIDILKSVIPGLVTMKFSTALAFFFSSLIVFFSVQSHFGKRTLADIFIPSSTLFLLLLMGTLLGSIFFGILSGIESIFIAERADAIFTAVPGRPSIGTVTNFVLLGVFGLFMMFHVAARRHVVRTLGRIVIIVASVAIVGFVINQPLLYYHIPRISSGMALHTATGFLLLGGVIFRMTFVTHSHHEDTV